MAEIDPLSQRACERFLDDLAAAVYRPVADLSVSAWPVFDSLTILA
jgi:hypothetical protein